jgi:hypothetical protein
MPEDKLHRITIQVTEEEFRWIKASEQASHKPLSFSVDRYTNPNEIFLIGPGGSTGLRLTNVAIPRGKKTPSQLNRELMKRQNNE